MVSYLNILYLCKWYKIDNHIALYSINQNNYKKISFESKFHKNLTKI